MIVTAVLTIMLWGMSPTDVVRVNVPFGDVVLSVERLPDGCSFDLNELWCWATGEQLVINATYTCGPLRAPAVVAVIADRWWWLYELRCKYRQWLPFISMSLSFLVYLSAGEYVQMHVYQNSGAALNIGSSSNTAFYCRMGFTKVA